LGSGVWLIDGLPLDAVSAVLLANRVIVVVEPLLCCRKRFVSTVNTDGRTFRGFCTESGSFTNIWNNAANTNPMPQTIYETFCNIRKNFVENLCKNFAKLVYLLV